VAVVSVLAEGNLTQEEIAELIHAVGVSHGEWVDHVADRLRHLFTAIEQEPVRENALRHGDARRHQKGRPIHRVKTDDVLADNVKRCGPVALEFLASAIGKSNSGDVGGEGAPPHVHDVAAAAGYANAPVESGA